MSIEETAPTMDDRSHWQLAMFRKSLKKKMRWGVLRRMLGDIRADDRCLLITCGDNNGAMNHHLRSLGGDWTFADLEDHCIAEMQDLLGQEVVVANPERLPYEGATFDRIVTIDVHEHLDDPGPFSREVGRIAKPGAQIICTVPNGDEDKLAVRVKHAIGMTPAAYGHSRVGLTTDELTELMSCGRIDCTRSTTFSRLFTELLELTINFAYVKVLAKGSAADVEEGQIAPATKDQLSSVRKSYRIYSVIYPLYWLFSQLDKLIAFTEGYVVVVEGRRAAEM
jgi:SAM-dependent methyltransferase